MDGSGIILSSLVCPLNRELVNLLLKLWREAYCKRIQDGKQEMYPELYALEKELSALGATYYQNSGRQLDLVVSIRMR